MRSPIHASSSAKKISSFLEVGVEGAASVARGGGDVLEARRLEAVARENTLRRGEQFPAA